MSTFVEFSWSWTTATLLVLSGVAQWIVRTRIRTHHLEVFNSLGLSKKWWKADLGSGFLEWLFMFRYLSLNDNALTVYCLVSKMIWLAAVYFFFTEPIFFESRTIS